MAVPWACSGRCVSAEVGGGAARMCCERRDNEAE